jgi:hypothetical protein
MYIEVKPFMPQRVARCGRGVRESKVTATIGLLPLFVVVEGFVAMLLY